MAICLEQLLGQRCAERQPRPLRERFWAFVPVVLLLAGFSQPQAIVLTGSLQMVRHGVRPFWNKTAPAQTSTASVH